MARKLRVQFEGAIYHVMLRGVEQRRIFADDADRARFLDRLSDGVAEYGVRVYLFCLMTNHVHLLVETPQGNLSAFMHKLETAYTVYFNLRHRRAGHLMQGRFGAEPVQGDEYLARLGRYQHLNPVHVGPVAALPLEERRRYLRAYPWSSYRGYAGLARPCGFVDEGPLLAMTEAPAKRQRRTYRRFVEAGLAESDTELRELLRGRRWGVGDGEFQAGIRDRHTDMTIAVRRREDVALRRVEPQVGAEAVLRAVAEVFAVEASALQRRQYDCPARAVAALMLGRMAGMNQRDAASYLGAGTGAAVCRLLRRLRERQAADPALRQQVARVEAALATQAAGAARPNVNS
jgi:putative transposase